MRAQGVVYLLHFQRAFWHARHYTGWTPDLGARIEAHMTGDGARLMEVIHDEAIPFALARIWDDGTRTMERTFKQRGAARHCPICKAEKAGQPYPVFWFLDPAVTERKVMGTIAIPGVTEITAQRQGAREADEVFRAACGKGDRTPAQIDAQVLSASSGLLDRARTGADRAWVKGFTETARTLAADYVQEYAGGWAGRGFTLPGDAPEIELEAG
jgi:predicted GIY-YIG superfamily endonuclease